ncbi:MAG TPA: hypothetical protein DEZ08_03905 [Dehalococcoidia bacterium]|jgi:hypothetical protein|nr:hypothetical protein [Dehalococcoidia bacterium]
MLEDPATLSSLNWMNIHYYLTSIWTLAPFVAAFAFSMAAAHLFIPSLVSTGDLPVTAKKFRLPLTAFALLMLIPIVVLLVMAFNMWMRVGDFWPRFLI